MAPRWLGPGSLRTGAVVSTVLGIEIVLLLSLWDNTSGSTKKALSDAGIEPSMRKV